MVVTIVISDDEPESPGATKPSSAKALGKRKQSIIDFEEKVAWTDESDKDGHDKVKQRAKRRAIARGKKPARRSASRGSKLKRKTPSDPKALANDDEPNDDDDDEYAGVKVPDYWLRRKKTFDRDRERLQHAGLRLPPDSSDIYFSDDEPGARLEERPKFDEKSGIRPCRPYRDIELETSAGVIPAPVAQYLRDYQVAGVQFLHERFVYQRGCILGDDMGLGKTVQVAAFLTAAFGKTGDERDFKRLRKMRRAGGRWYPRVLIICPGSLLRNWQNELARWGWWHVDVYHGPDKESVLESARAGWLEVMITTYTTYKNHQEAVNEVEWDCVVADECHQLKDRRSEVTQAMDGVNALCRIGLTGTAIQNKYEELWTLLNWTNPGHFGTIAEWNSMITKPLTVGQSHDATLKQLSLARTTAKKLVQNLLPEFFLRRTKALIAHQLPKKTDKVVFCPLTDVQREAYQNFLQGDNVSFITLAGEPCKCDSGRKRGWCCFKQLPDGKPWMSAVFPSIMTLQKLSNHLTLLIPSSADPHDKQASELKALRTCVPHHWKELWQNRDSMLSLANPEFCGKWKVLKKLLSFWHANGDKVLVFSHSVRLLRILQHLFHNTCYNVSFLDGSLSYDDRQKVVDGFNSDPAQFVFLISTKAGGVGLNITSANKVVVFDPHWNPAYDLQAQDRAYRIGQVRDVDVFRLVSAGTIEEIVYARQIYKQQQANIGYSASSERRYFKGVQQDSRRKGEIFGLKNLFSFHADQVVLREIVNKTNIAEAKVGVHLTEIDMERAAKDEGDELTLIKQEPGGDGTNDDEADGGMGQLAKLLTAEDQEALINAKKKASRPRKSDVIAGILASAGVEYTHENSEVIGTSRVEEQLSRRAELAAAAGAAGMDGDDDDDSSDLDGSSALFADHQANGVIVHSRGASSSGSGRGGRGGGKLVRLHHEFNPPVDVMRRQFCSMAREFGFPSATDFALVVESWSQEQRRNCLDHFYQARKRKVLKELEGLEELERENARFKREDKEEEEEEEEEENARFKKEVKEEGNEERMKVEVSTEVEEEKKAEEGGIASPIVQVKEKVEEGGIASPIVKVMTERPEQTRPQARRVVSIFLSDNDEDDEL
ncbi:hypothetical protein VTJ83DRAFT_3563 [Remersonia thermophila]|uniref:Uncharacterized protein n=1 Tax=Remersonia thermophila TaxID=72144 RepID=A0ABR4DEF2_9PEZI